MAAAKNILRRLHRWSLHLLGLHILAITACLALMLLSYLGGMWGIKLYNFSKVLAECLMVSVIVIALIWLVSSLLVAARLRTRPIVNRQISIENLQDDSLFQTRRVKLGHDGEIMTMADLIDQSDYL